MISGHGTNPIFLNKKHKEWTSRTSATLQPLRPITSHFCLTPLLPSKKMPLYVSLLNKNVYEICAIALASDLTLHIKNTRAVCRTS